MAQETAPATTPEIDVRWELAIYGRPTRYVGENSIRLELTKRFDRVQRGLEDIGAMLVEEGVGSEEAAEDADSLEALLGQTWIDIERRFKAWAARADERRTRIQAAKAGTAA